MWRNVQQSALIVFQAAALVVLLQLPAEAWSQEFNTGTGPCNPCVQWPAASSRVYFLSSAVTAHSSWPSIVATQIGYWNGAPAANPNWSRTYTQAGNYMYVSVSASIGTDCGRADWSYSGGYYVYHSLYVYNQLRDYRAGSGCDFVNTTGHEQGHAAEVLGHSTDPGALMHPTTISPQRPNSDDIAGVRAVYGAL